MTMKCSDVQELLAPYADSVLAEVEQQTAEEHISHCDSCRLRVEAQQSVAIALRSLKRSQRAEAPSDHVLREIRAQWNRMDVRPRRQLRTQLASVAALLLVCTFGVVWARLAVDRSFPANFIIENYKQIAASPLQPQYLTSDPANGAKWLRAKLHAPVPPVNMSLVNAKLVGVSVIRLNGITSGQMLFNTPAGFAAVYVVPGRTAFRSLSTAQLDGNHFHALTDVGEPGLYAWSYNGLGFGVADTSASEAETCAVAAQRSTSMP